MEKNKITQWSFSRFSQYESCPFKTKLKYIDKMEEPTSAPLERGSRIHALAENYIKGNLPEFPPELEKHQRFIENLRNLYANSNLNYKIIVEDEWAFTENWQETGWTAPDAWVRIKLDCIMIDQEDKSAVIVDWKTGKLNKNLHEQYKKQLELYALATLLKFPELEHVFPKLYYLDTGDTFPEFVEDGVYSRGQIEELKIKWKNNVKALLSDNIFAPRPSWLCRYCHFRKGNGGPCKF